MEHYEASNSTTPVLIGTCAWTDVSFTRDSHFFPISARKNAETILQHYATALSGQVEIDTSTYAIPSRYKLQEWANAVPDGFIFHIKAFGFLCSRGGTVGSLPRDLREQYLADLLMNDAAAEQKHIAMAQLPPEMVLRLWERMNESIAVLHEAGKLGAVLFQVHASSFPPSVDNMRYLAECRMRLRHPASGTLYPMAVEFREHAWFSSSSTASTAQAGGTTSDPGSNSVGSHGRVAVFPESEYPPEAQVGRPIPGTRGPPVPPLPPFMSANTPFQSQRQATLYFMRRMGIATVAADDLADELPIHEPAQPCTRDGRVLIPEDLSCPSFAYIRIHRRSGDYRLLSQQEMEEWASRVHRMAATADGPAAYASACAATIAEQPILMSRGRMASGPAADRKPATGSGDEGASHAEGRGSAGEGDAIPLLVQPERKDTAAAYSLIPELPPPLPSLPSSTALMLGRQQQSFVDHPWFFTRLQGPVCINVATYHADHPILNIRGLSAAIDGNPQRSAQAATASASDELATSGDRGLRHRAKMYDWKAKMAQHHRKHGLEGFFARQKEQQATPSPATAETSLQSDANVQAGQKEELTAGMKRSRQDRDEPGTTDRVSARAPMSSSPTLPSASSSPAAGAGRSRPSGQGEGQASAQKQLTSFFAPKK